MTPVPFLRLRSADQREYRRGMVLGLTMAEVAILLIFLLMLAMRLEGQAEGDAFRFLAASEASVLEHQATAERAEAEAEAQRARAEQAERERDSARTANSDAQTRLDEMIASNAGLQRALYQVRSRMANDRAWLNLDPDSSDEQIVGALVRRLDELTSDNRRASGDLERIIRENEVLRGQNEQLRRDLARQPGRPGSGVPHCWPTPSGDAEYMLRISMHDGGMVSVRDRSPKAQPSDTAWHLVAGLQRDKQMSIAELRTTVEPLIARGRSQGCRYAVEVVDMTGPTNKLGYKSLQNAIWTIFYQKEVAR